MESLLAKKIEMNAHPAGHPSDRRLLRTDSLDSTSSLGSIGSSLALGDDVCRCDDCLLGIADLYTIGPTERAMAKKKVTYVISMTYGNGPYL